MTAPTEPDASRPAEAAAAAPKRAAGEYTAIVYFHGIGSQRRYGEMSRLIDALDLYAQPGRDGVSGALRDIHGKLEECRVPGHPDVGFAEASYVTAQAGRRFRFYEVYWAPAAAKGVPAREVLLWLARNLVRPLQVRCTPWREHGRLRLSSLAQIQTRHGADATPDEARSLRRAYDRLRGAEGRNRCPRGTFNDYLELLAEDAGDAGRERTRLARQWRRSFINSLWAYQAVLITFALTAGLIAAAATGLVLMGLQGLTTLEWLQGWAGERLAPSWPNAFALASATVLGLGVGRFLTTAVGDVVFWTTTSETDERHAVRADILGRGAVMLRHVLGDERCTRAIVVAHSLGTAVAYESLLEVGRFNRAREAQQPQRSPLRIDKLDQFVTLASPIDRIQFFFDSARGGHRFTRVNDEIRGDMSALPFRANRKPHVHWLNIWDRADLIGGRLGSPAATEQFDLLPVNNIEVDSGWFPKPASSHSSYFRDRFVVATLFEVIFRGARSYTAITAARSARIQALQQSAKAGGVPYRHDAAAITPNYADADVAGLGTAPTTAAAQAGLLAAPWLAALYASSRALEWPASLVAGITTVSAVVLAGLVVLFVADRVRGHPRPLAGRR